MSYFGIVQDYSVTGTITSVGTGISIAMQGRNSVAATITGTWSGSMVVDASCDQGQNWSSSYFGSIGTEPAFSGVPDTVGITTTNGIYRIFNTTGATHIRVRASAFTSGTANVYLGAVQSPASFTFMRGAIIQDVYIDPNNSSTTTIGAGSTFTGTALNTTGASAIQVTLKTDQNCMVYIDQSQDGTNWDITDSYIYYYTIGNFGVTVQAVSTYCRIRVANTGISTTTYFRLNTVLCPIVEALPRALDQDGNLKTAIKSITDRYGNEVEATLMGEMRIAEPVRLVGATFIGTAVDANFWTVNVGGGATIYNSGSQVVLNTLGGSGATSLLQTTRVARYVGGSSHRYRAVIRVPDTGFTSSVRRWGAYNGTDGAFFTFDGNAVGCVTMKAGTATTVASGGFNGSTGAYYTMSTTVNTYEIYWTNSRVQFAIGNELIHTVSAGSTTWANTLHLPVRLECNNYSGIATSAIALECRTATICRLGRIDTAPNYKHLASGTNTLLKNGPGRLQKVIVGTYTNGGIITLYDSPSGTGNSIASLTLASTNTGPVSLEFNLDFYNGLNATLSNIGSATFIYE